MVTPKVMPTTCCYLTNTLRPIAARFKQMIRERYCGPTRLDDDARCQLAEIIFQIENDLEHQHPRHPQVSVLRAVRNVLLDDLGENENLPGSHYPRIEAVAAVIAEKRHAGQSREHMLSITPTRCQNATTDASESDDISSDDSEVMGSPKNRRVA